jgi:ubiquinone/menaquinone biosynthesis C-methylase UbiE
MESDEEFFRLELKTDINAVNDQARWAGIEPGMRVLDVGCGIGKTTLALCDLVQPGGSAVGIDFLEQRIKCAEEARGEKNVEFICRDFTQPLDDLELFDFVWIRFVLEYFRNEAFELVRKISRILKPGGTLCLIDLDYNCMSHFEMPERLEKTLMELIATLEEKATFDPYMGRKLYSYLYKLGFADIRVRVGAHHLIYGDLGNVDAYNWLKKLEVASKRIGFDFHRYSSGYEGCVEEFTAFFNNPGRFTYTPLISACGHRRRDEPQFLFCKKMPPC